MFCFFYFLLLKDQTFTHVVNGSKLLIQIIDDKSLQINFAKSLKKKKSLGDIKIPSTISNMGSSRKVTRIGPKAFCESNISSIILPKTIENIGKYAFHNSTIKEVDMGETRVKEIPVKCFSSCFFLKKIILPKCLINISAKAFSLSSIEDIKFPGTLEEIGNKAFGLCINLRFVDLSQTKLKIIDNYTFFSSMLKSLKLPDSIQKIGEYAFYKCPLSKISLPVSVSAVSNFSFSFTLFQTLDLQETRIKALPNSCFSSCPLLKSIKLPKYLVNIDEYCFSDCTLLKEIEFNNKIQYIEEFAFLNTSLTKIEFPESILGLGHGAFENCSKLEVADLSKTGITSTGHSTFAFDARLSKVVFPHSLKTIGQKCFMHCYSLLEIDFPSSLQKIESSSFYQAGIKKPDFAMTHITRIPANSFMNTFNLETVILNEEVTSIGSFAFKNSSIKTLDFPRTLQVLGVGCFEFSMVTEVDLSACSLKTIASNAFFNCKNLTDVLFPATLEQIEEKAFVSTQISDISFPAALISIGNSSFMGCKNITTIDLTSTKVEILGVSAFGSCTELNTLFLPFTLKVIPPTLCVSSKITSVFLPPNVCNISYCSFSSLALLTMVDMSQSNVTAIPGLSFSNCPRLRLIHLPDVLKVIEADAFYKSSYMKEFIYCGTKVFDGNVIIPSLVKVSVLGNYNFDLFMGVKVTFIDDCPFINITRPNLEFEA